MLDSGKPKVSTEVPGCKCGVEWNQNSGRKRRSTSNTTISDSDNNRIIGGTKIDKQTQMRKYPWLSLLWFRSTNTQQHPTGYAGWAGCGGTLVASNYVISAAHCIFKQECDQDTGVCLIVKEYTKDNLAWRVGDHDRLDYGETGYEQFVHIKNMHKHPDYPQRIYAPLIGTPYYDIVVYELEKMLPLHAYTPACLPRPGEDARFDGKMATIAGWGRLKFADKTHPSEPYEVNVPVSRTDTCPLSIEQPVKICLGQNSPIHKGACKVVIWRTRLRPRYRSVSALALRAAGGFIPIDLCLPFNHQSLSCGRQGLPFDHQGLSFGHPQVGRR